VARIDCPHCGVAIRIPPLAKKSVTCPACRKEVDLEDVPIDSDEAEAEGRKKPKKKRYLYADDEDEHRPAQERRPRKARKVRKRPDWDRPDSADKATSIIGWILMIAGIVATVLFILMMVVDFRFGCCTVVGPGLFVVGYKVLHWRSL
jgi:uncharacterized Zn finger protein (UPF0148 family)